jgi:tight adherence protein B
MSAVTSRPVVLGSVVGWAARHQVRCRLGITHEGRGPSVASRLRSLADAVRERWAPTADDEAVARLLGAVAAQLRSGSSVSSAVVLVAGGSGVDPVPAAIALARAMARHGRGLTFEDAIESWVRDRPTPAVRLAGATLLLGATTGGALGRACDAAAATLRQRAAVRHEVRAQAAQARMSALVVAVAPPAFTAVAAITDPGVARFLLATPWGWACMVAGIAADAVGLVWMRAIVARVGR